MRVFNGQKRESNERPQFISKKRKARPQSRRAGGGAVEKWQMCHKGRRKANGGKEVQLQHADSMACDAKTQCIMVDPNTRIIDMTLADLLAVIDERMASKEQASTLPSVVYGYEGVQEIFKCCRETARSIVKSGRIDAAITRVSPRKIMIDTNKAKSLLNNH